MSKTTEIINSLLAHEINKHEAIDQLEMLNQINSSNVAEALKEAVSALYFADSSDYKTALYDVVRHLFSLDEVDYEKIKKLYKLFHDEN